MHVPILKTYTNNDNVQDRKIQKNIAEDDILSI